MLALLLTACWAGTVQLSTGSTATVANLLFKSLSSSYSLSDGYTWVRQRSGSYNKFSEFY